MPSRHSVIPPSAKPMPELIRLLVWTVLQVPVRTLHTETHHVSELPASLFRQLCSPSLVVFLNLGVIDGNKLPNYKWFRCHNNIIEPVTQTAIREELGADLQPAFDHELSNYEVVDVNDLEYHMKMLIAKLTTQESLQEANLRVIMAGMRDLRYS